MNFEEFLAGLRFEQFDWLDWCMKAKLDNFAPDCIQ
jgi:hypothetical protein